jgi:L-alanine-DL-glutamate epimerase-like enolase superfamily enzyme
VSAASIIGRVEAQAYRVPTDSPEADGTAEWCSTTIVIAHVHAGGHVGLGYTYAHRDAAALIASPLADCLVGRSADDIPALWAAMNRRLRNIGRAGVGLMAIAALDHALWDLKARLHGLSVVCSGARATSSRCTAAADSLPTRTTICSGNWPAGSRQGSPASR